MSVYSDRSGEPTLIDSIVGFIDLLGSRATADRELQERRLHQLVKGIRKARSLAALPSVDGYCATATFTDNIVIGFPVDQTGDPPLTDPDRVWAVLLRVIAAAASYQLELAKEGLFARGGIALGPLWLDETFVFGDGLNSAYKLESTVARYPRIVLSTELVDLVQWLKPHLTRGVSRSWLDSYLIKGWDGQVFISYLFDESTRVEKQDDFLQVHKDAVVEGLFDTRHQPGIYEKYLWLRTYHNYFCKKIGRQELLLDSPDDLYEFSELE
jgi:hypothetical protein